MIRLSGDVLRSRIDVAFRVQGDKPTRYGSVRWFARQCRVNETTVWTWVRDGRITKAGIAVLEGAERAAREAAEERLALARGEAETTFLEEVEALTESR